MGGRGSSSSGGGGRFGRGGGIKQSDIENTYSLISARNSGYRKEADQVLTVGRDVYNQYGVAPNYEVAQLKNGGIGTLAYMDAGGNLAVNRTYFNDKAMNKNYDQSVKDGFHPSRGNKTGLEAVASHEMGHFLTSKVATKLGMSSADFDKASGKILEQAKKKAGYKKAYDMASKISGYATHSKSEAVAEAFADVYCNGGKAKKESHAIVDVLNSYFKK